MIKIEINKFLSIIIYNNKKCKLKKNICHLILKDLKTAFKLNNEIKTAFQIKIKI